jgi:hypothetical protein
MAGRGDPLPMAASEVPDIAAQLIPQRATPIHGHGLPSCYWRRAPAVDPCLVWVTTAGDPREAPEGKGEDVGELSQASLAKAVGRRWAAAALAMLPSRGGAS